MKRFPPRRITLAATGLAALTFGFSLALWQRNARLESTEGTRLVPSAQFSQIEKLESQPTIEATAENTPVAIPQGTLAKESWSAIASHTLISTPAVTADRALVGTKNGTLEVWSRGSTPRLLYRLVKREPIYSTPVIHDGIAYIGEGLGNATAIRLTALDIKNARVLWEREFHGHIEAAPLLDNGTLYIGAGSGGIWAIRASNGKLVWHAPLGHVDATPVRIGDTIYSSAQTTHGTKVETKLIALDASSAEVRWSCSLPGQPWGSPLRGANGGDVLLTTAQGQSGPPQKSDRGWSHAVDAKTGKLHWTMELPGMPLLKSVVLEEKQLLIHTLKTGEIIAVQLGEKSGSHAWTAQLRSRVQAEGTIIDGRWLAIITESGTLALRDVRNGKEIQKINVGKEGSVSATSDGSDLFVASPTSLTAFHFKTTISDAAAAVTTTAAPASSEANTAAEAAPSYPTGTTDTLESNGAERSPADIGGAPGTIIEDDPEDEQLPEGGE